MKAWLAKLSGAMVISTMAAALGLLAGILVLRLLDPDDAGRYTLIISMATFIGIASLFGQPNLINRLYARSQTPYHWPRDLFNALQLSGLVILLCLVFVLVFYRLTAFEIGFVAGFSLLTAVVNTSAYMLNSYRHYIWSTLLMRLPNALFILPLGLMALGFFSAKPNSLLGSQLVIVTLCASLGIAGLLIHLPTGLQPIPLEERKETFGMAILVLTHLLLDPGLIVIAGLRLPPASIAGFGGYFNLLGPFLLLWSILIQTISVEFGRNPSFPKRRILQTVWGLLIPIAVGSWAILPKLVHFLYDGKYDGFTGIALPISLIGGLLLIEAVPRGFVTALTDNLTLRKFIRDQAWMALLMLGLEILLLNRLGVYGVAWTGVFLMLGRSLVVYKYFWITRDQRKSSV